MYDPASKLLWLNFHQAAEAAASRFDMLFVLVGSSVNEDGGLGAYHCTPGLVGVFDDILLGDDDIIGLVRERSLYAALTMHYHTLINYLSSNLARKTFAQHYLAVRNRSVTEQPVRPPSESGDDAGAGINLIDDSPVDNEDKISTAKIDEKRNIIKGAMLKGFGKFLACKIPNALNTKLTCFVSGRWLPSPPQRWFESRYPSLDEPSQNPKRARRLY